MQRKLSNRILTAAAIIGFVSTAVLAYSWVKWKNELDKQEHIKSIKIEK